MKRAAVRGGVGIIATLALLGVLAAPAGAQPPLVERNELTFPEEPGSFDCGGGVTYDIALSGTEIVRVFFGSDGPEHVKMHVNCRGDIVASTGTTLRVNHAFNVDIDLVRGTLRITGLPFGTWVNGSALKALDRGVLEVDLGSGEVIFEAGRHDWPHDPHGTTCALIAAAAAG